MQELAKLAEDLRVLVAEQKIMVTPLLSDCLQTYFITSGISAWIAQNVNGPFQILTMSGVHDMHYYDVPSASNAPKPWWKSNQRGCPGDNLSSTLHILFRFEDPADAMFFKMSYLDGK